jgi:HSP20 family protein
MLWNDPFALFTTQVNRAAFLPPADVTVSEDDMVLTMDLPGLTADDLEIELVDGSLSVRGERKRPEVAEGTSWAHNERAFGRFERRVKLPDGVDPDKVTASMDNGVLSLIVPKPDKMIPRTISIGSGSEQRQLETSAA